MTNIIKKIQLRGWTGKKFNEVKSEVKRFLNNIDNENCV